jgi:plasmid stabilization system protein ParE
MNIRFLPVAEQELDDAFCWYEEQAVGLGDVFLNEINKSLQLVATYPKVQTTVHNGIRRCLVNRFPYGIFYGIKNDSAVIVAVAHLKRQPKYWSQR